MVESLGEISTAAERVAGGDLTATVRPRSEQDRLGRAFQQLLQTTGELVAETDQLVRAAQDGRLDRRGTPEQFQGAFRDLVQGMNATLDAFVAPVNEAAAVLGRVAERDLTARMQGAYQGEFATIKTALNSAVQNLEDALFQVTVSAEQITVASGQIGNGSHSLAQGASEQAGALEEVAGSLQEMASMTRQNAANAQEARSLTEGARSTAEKGTDSMQRLSSAIDQIHSSAGATAKIVKTIDEIAFQTNLLALNAAVEAARAGDAGKGFAVVAEEVRNLAMRSAEAAKNTAQLIEESVRNAESGVTINGEVLRNLSEINEQVNKVGEVMGEVAAASGQQSQGVEQITSAVEQMNQVTQQTAANAEASASAAEELTAQSEEMKSMVATFRLSTAGAGLQGGRSAPTWNGAVRPAPAPLFEGKPRAATRPTPATEGGRPAASPLPLAGAPKRNGKANGNGAGRGLAMDPRNVIPFDEDDRDILKEF
jgi:methyl-accepting chemotaxis protein